MKQYAQRMGIAFENESANIHEVFCWRSEVSLRSAEVVVLFVNGMICCLTSKRTIDASALEVRPL